MRKLPQEIPSPIDVHVHLREPGGEIKETIASGTYAALSGGYQAVFDMPNNPRFPTYSLDRLSEKQRIAERTSHVDIGFYAGIDLANPDFEQIPKMIGRAAGLKLYMDHTTGNSKSFDMGAAKPVIDRWVKEAKDRGLHAPILLHARENVGYATARYIAGLGHFAHWCHLSTASEAKYAQILTEAYEDRFTAGVTPHHLTMTNTNARFQQRWNGARMMPPLAREADRDALMEAYNSLFIKILETDHAPHTAEEKLAVEANNPEGWTDPDCKTCFGISGIEFVLPVMTAAVYAGDIDVDRLVDSLYDQPKRMLGLGKEAMRSVTTLEWGPYTIGESDFRGKSRNVPYIGWTAGARVTGVTKADEAIETIGAQSKNA